MTKNTILSYTQGASLVPPSSFREHYPLGFGTFYCQKVHTPQLDSFVNVATHQKKPYQVPFDHGLASERTHTGFTGGF